MLVEVEIWLVLLPLVIPELLLDVGEDMGSLKLLDDVG